MENSYTLTELHAPSIFLTLSLVFLTVYSFFLDPSDSASTLSQSCSQSHASVPVAMATTAAVAAPSHVSTMDNQCTYKIGRGYGVVVPMEHAVGRDCSVL